VFKNVFIGAADHWNVRHAGWLLASHRQEWSTTWVNGANAVPVVGTPLAIGLAVIVLVFVVFAKPWSDALVTLAHEGGHYSMAILTGYRPNSYEVDEDGGGGTGYESDWWSPLRVLRIFAGYATPPLLGLGGATLIARGHTWSVLVIALVLLLASFLIATNSIAIAIAGTAVLGIGAALAIGSPQVQASLAVGLVWLLLLGGMYDALTIPRGNNSSDIAKLQRDTVIIPRIAWKAAFVLIGLFCLYKGGRDLLQA